MKINLMIALLVLACTSCSKNEDQVKLPSPVSTAAIGEVTAAATTTVTTEAALKTAVANAKAGDVIAISGTINLTSTLQLLNSGTSSSKINIYGGTLNAAGAGSWAVKVNGSYWNIQNMRITGGPSSGIVFQSGGNNYVNNITSDYNGNTGIQVYNGAYNVSINNSYSNQNYDVSAGGEDADGFACKLSSGTGNSFTGCYASYNSDDGWDLYGNPAPVKISGCTAEHNGKGSNGDGNGFKLGSSGQSIAHTITNCVANYNSPGWGFTRNGNAKGVIIYSGLSGTGNAAGLSDL
ncbi:right-handed parallel beta-helix repeat-containing protein [[Flexibacter] sp. ATCC 35208]|uniref:right-handed parallel beta-helix repeat-containing protein n=1 Tax=[Flexibacter] sp. ATCC 35208 TaxID=1936242 RepID=UPI0009D61935|nr:right-handed parallel beta-helix repeat-containing protein [[Flexibacter] sp. ATCC 35208]OMP74537.1 pectate lyase [[Flexibacter] sp. ATCC 35208]OMP75555.1 pectate lyase [[Flexibacter] sp. ATCC 35208]